ncbi:Fe-S cluster assembly protein SufD [Pararhodospirillum oryzae]|uniref:Fe-S cluster assembly protein SufD n=1 Tax=Pararhodospirillum oryzae TaxID=478448 RepID=A0A512H4R5_9PROT|nr:Fe-S cluster assembly protein SufD [Pararhodospirillum oryzae]GEO80427.1 Fe-S cluster assembly protein SufD [Pararhodospirillum oryzae]
MTATPVAAATPFLDPETRAEGGGWLGAVRQAGLDGYRRQGFPTPRHEAWKYTNLSAVGRLAVETPPAVPALTAADLPGDRLLPLDVPRLVFVNGRFSAPLSDLDRLPAGVRAGSLRAVLLTDPGHLRPVLERPQAQEAVATLPLAALNTGFLSDGLVLEIDAGVSVEGPLHIIHLSVPGESATLAHPRGLIRLGAGARATLAVSYSGLPGAPSVINAVTDVVLGEDAHLSHVRLLAEAPEGVHIGAVLATVGARARYDAFTLTLGGRLVRNEIRVLLDGEGAQAHVNGAYAARKGQHIDNTVFVDHAVPNAKSSQLFKGVLDETGRGVFQGKILVRRDAQGTDGQQLHQALLLTPGAEVDIKPELQIYADDVACSHGATAGEMDAEALFYLQSRGIDEETARALLVEAFLEDALTTVADEAVRDALTERVRDWQRGRAQATWNV